MGLPSNRPGRGNQPDRVQSPIHCYGRRPNLGGVRQVGQRPNGPAAVRRGPGAAGICVAAGFGAKALTFRAPDLMLWHTGTMTLAPAAIGPAGLGTYKKGLAAFSVGWLNMISRPRRAPSSPQLASTTCRPARCPKGSSPPSRPCLRHRRNCHYNPRSCAAG